MALQFKNYFNFSRGEWSAIILLLLLILFSFLIYYLYEEHTDSDFDLIGYQNEIHEFEKQQLFLADSHAREREKRQEAYEQRYSTYKKKNRFNYEYYERKRRNDYISKKENDTSKRQFSIKSSPAYRLMKVELNSCDTDEIVKIPRFGVKRALKIIEYRERLGGYAKLSQLHEIFIIKDIEMDYLETYFEVNPEGIKQIYVNKDSYKELVRHPYFDAYLAKSVIKYREKTGKINSLQEFQQCTHAYKELLEKLEPYLNFE